MIEEADHGLSAEPWQQAYTTLLVNWVTEMVFGARQGEATPKSQADASLFVQKAMARSQR